MGASGLIPKAKPDGQPKPSHREMARRPVCGAGASRGIELTQHRFRHRVIEGAAGGPRFAMPAVEGTNMAWEEASIPRYIWRTGNPLLWLLNGSVPLFTAFRVPVRLHASFIIFVGVGVIISAFGGEHSLQYSVVAMGMLFFLVVLHEFGHCFASRSVGGDADHILLTPLGGLAFADSPKHPWPRFSLGGRRPGRECGRMPADDGGHCPVFGSP